MPANPVLPYPGGVGLKPSGLFVEKETRPEAVFKAARAKSRFVPEG